MHKLCCHYIFSACFWGIGTQKLSTNSLNEMVTYNCISYTVCAPNAMFPIINFNAILLVQSNRLANNNNVPNIFFFSSFGTNIGTIWQTKKVKYFKIQFKIATPNFLFLDGNQCCKMACRSNRKMVRQKCVSLHIPYFTD